MMSAVCPAPKYIIKMNGIIGAIGEYSPAVREAPQGAKPLPEVPCCPSSWQVKLIAKCGALSCLQRFLGPRVKGASAGFGLEALCAGPGRGEPLGSGSLV